jgi:Raf kinase inhibitor-like YbhB/YbcL family protein
VGALGDLQARSRAAVVARGTLGRVAARVAGPGAARENALRYAKGDEASRLESPVRALQGRNSWPSGRTTGYRGPAPPPGHGVHHYHFKLYALDCELKLNPAVDKDTLVKATDGHVLAQAELVGTYQR